VCLQRTLGWSPDGEIRGVYWTELREGPDFAVHGIIDIDDDDAFAEYTATASQNATIVGERDVY
jgi:hypothetical protein